jgi:pyruvate-formate lyase-activating enzyme
MKLEEIGFYTLTDDRAKNASEVSPMWRCELIITDACNFKCAYCRGLRDDCQGTRTLEECKRSVDLWAADGLRNVRFSGGEPTIHPKLVELVEHTKQLGVEHIAISTNGSADPELYKRLVDAGANDFSVSLDACCASGVEKMAVINGNGERVLDSIRLLSKLTYTTVGVVLTNDNIHELVKIVNLAHDLGVADIRLISAAQENRLLEEASNIAEAILDAHPILKYRVNNIGKGRNVRGLQPTDCKTCHLLRDDSVVAGNYHFPCVIYMREGGNPIGKVGENMRQERIRWLENTDVYQEEICRQNCLDVCIDYNNKAETWKSARKLQRA